MVEEGDRWLQLISHGPLFPGSVESHVDVYVRGDRYRYEGPRFMADKFLRAHKKNQHAALEVLKKHATRWKKVEDVDVMEALAVLSRSMNKAFK